MSEKELINKIQLEFSIRGHRIFRQNVGSSWVGRFIKSPMRTSITVNPSDVIIKDARPFHAGLCKGSSDLIGWKKIVVTPDMVGKTIAVFSAIEVKYGKTKATDEQKRFVQNVNDAGGFGKIVYSLDEVFND